MWTLAESHLWIGGLVVLGRSATCSMAVLVPELGLDIDGDIDSTQEQDRVGIWEGRLIELQEFVNCKSRQNRTAAPIPPALTKKRVCRLIS